MLKFNDLKFKKFIISFLWIFLAFLLILIILLLFYLGDYFINYKTGKVKSPLIDSYVIVSESMVPTINVGDIVIIKRKKNNNYNIGDIITFYSDDGNYKGLIITHRVIDKKKNNNSFNYFTKGDNNIGSDPWIIRSSNIYGKVLFKIPKGSFLYGFFNSFIYIILFVFLVAFTILFLLLKRKKCSYLLLF